MDDLLSRDDLRRWVDDPVDANSEAVPMAAELLLAREVIALFHPPHEAAPHLTGEDGDWWLWTWDEGAVRFTGRPLSDARPDLAAYLDNLEKLNDADE